MNAARIALAGLALCAGCLGGFRLCGDGIIEPGEGCDDGFANSDTEPGACPTDCDPGVCGNGVPERGELCDDGDDEDGDACSADCRRIEGTYFLTAEDLNGEQPDLAVHSIFGEAGPDITADGFSDLRYLVVFASDNPAICDAIAARGLRQFIVDLIDGLVPGETLFVWAANTALDPRLPMPPGVVVGGTAVNGFVTTSVDGGFLIAGGAGVITVNTLLGGDNVETDRMTVISLDAGELVAAYQSILRDEFVSAPEGGTIELLFQGAVRASECPAVTAGLQELAEIFFID
jgi:cysteine-rich repeat protein